MRRSFDLLCKDNTKAKWKSKGWRLLMNITLCSEIGMLEYSQINIDLHNITLSIDQMQENPTSPSINNRAIMYKKHLTFHQLR